MSGLQYRGEPDQWSPLKRNRRDHTLTISWPRPGSKWALVDMPSLQKKIIRNSFFKFANPAALNELAQIHWFKHFQLAKKKEIVIVAEMMSQHCLESFDLGGNGDSCRLCVLAVNFLLYGLT